MEITTTWITVTDAEVYDRRVVENAKKGVPQVIIIDGRPYDVVGAREEVPGAWPYGVEIQIRTKENKW